MQSTTLGHAIGSFCVRLLSMSCQIVVCCNHKGSFISIINTRYASNATPERGTQTGIDPATFETEGKSRNHSATTRPLLIIVVLIIVVIIVVVIGVIIVIIVIIIAVIIVIIIVIVFMLHRIQ